MLDPGPESVIGPPTDITKGPTGDETEAGAIGLMKEIERLRALVEPKRIVWVVGQIREWPAWELQGVYDVEADAVASCLDEKWFVGPIKMNSPLLRETVPWPSGARYPKAIQEIPVE